MFARALRGSVFISLMLIVSMTLTGCSIDIGSIVSGLQNVIGDIGGKMGGFLEKGVGFAKDFIGKAKEFAGPLIEKGKEMFKEFAPTAEKIQDGFGKVKGVLDKAGEVAKKVNNFSVDVAKKGVDAVGDSLNPAKAVAEIILDPDNEDSETTAKPADTSTTGSSSDSTAASEVANSAELQAKAKEVVEGTQKISDGVSKLADQINKLNMPDVEKQDLLKKIGAIKENMAIIMKDPSSSNSKALFDKSKGDVEYVLEKAKKYGDIAKGTLDSLKAATEKAKETYNKFTDAYNSIKSIFSKK